ncbi:alpha/beta fold hydrolase [Halomonas piscis]|uniref:alpha/beta fold hydrolase n=1 Tax=Halomonas piscis TaxID=3031727 RepID=UPI0028972B5C|nr:alpha/beta hydrolase [Halomonas piscis]
MHPSQTLAGTALVFLFGGTAMGAQADAAPPSTVPDPAAVEIDSGFDHIGADVHRIEIDDRPVFYLDDGPAEGRPVVFIGGQGTSLAAFQLSEFNRSLRLELGLRMISVERNGFGESPFNPELGYSDYTDEVLGVLDHRGVDEFAIVAISGGGAYAAQLAAAVPDRVLSLHAAAAVSSTLPTRDAPDCDTSLAEMKEEVSRYTHHPKDWWGVPGSPVQAIPGWQAAAYGDATRAFYVNGQMGDPSALAAEYRRPCTDEAVVDAERITAPTYLYWGEEDTTVPVKVMEHWKEALPNVARATVYPGQGHTVQYRHWDQVLTDIAGLGDHRVVCRDGETLLASREELGEDAFLGNCAWQGSDSDRAKQ